MARLWARTAGFESVAVGDTLPVIIKWETEESIRRYVALNGGGDGDVLPRETLVGYVVELLSKGFPSEGLEGEGSSLEVEQLRAVCADDTISLSGRVVGKGTAGGLRLVECAVGVENDRGEVVARARAVVSL